MGTFGKVDYRVRAAKQIERKMIMEGLQTLRKVTDLSDAEYVGFGSLSFIDFAMAHRALGISRMHSIEKEEFHARAKHNAPFSCITVHPSTSHEFLPEHDFDTPAVVWLDYDSKINEPILSDIGYCAEKLLPGSFLLVTLPAAAGHESNPNPKAELEALKRSLNFSRLPAAIKANDLSGWGYASFIRSVIDAELQSRVATRNLGLAAPEKVQLRQAMNFLYSDGMRMVTLGWLVDVGDPTQSRLLENSGMNKCSFFRDGEQGFVIKPPVLTPLEIRHLNAQLPGNGVNPIECVGVPKEQIDAYSELYRHFPAYFEVVEA